MNRPTFALLCVLTLLMLPAVTLAQSPGTQTAAPAHESREKETVLFDFEAGNFDGWTLTGDCWDKASASAKTFTDRQGNPLVSGIVGTGYLTTLFRSAATTGKAVSKDFAIDKPFLTFRIGGGNYPKEACLNLIVDGTIVRTETGYDSAELRPAYWDVYPLLGKTAHLEIVDATTNPNRGYIMLDDIRLTERPQRHRDLIVTEITPVHVKVVNFISIPRNMTDCNIAVFNRLPLPTPWCEGPTKVVWTPSAGKMRDDDLTSNPELKKMASSFQCQPYPSQVMAWEGTGKDSTLSEVTCSYDLVLARRTFDSSKHIQTTVRDLADTPQALRDEVTSVQKRLILRS